MKLINHSLHQSSFVSSDDDDNSSTIASTEFKIAVDDDADESRQDTEEPPAPSVLSPRASPKRQRRRRVYFDESRNHSIDNNQSLSPEECHASWYNHAELEEMRNTFEATVTTAGVEEDFEASAIGGDCTSSSSAG